MRFITVVLDCANSNSYSRKCAVILSYRAFTLVVLVGLMQKSHRPPASGSPGSYHHLL